MSNSLIKGIHHISMKCNEHEIDEVIHFYKDILELDIYNEWDTGIMFDTGSGVIEIFHNGETAPKGTIRHFALDVTDTKALTERIRNAGYEIGRGVRLYRMASAYSDNDRFYEARRLRRNGSRRCVFFGRMLRFGKMLRRNGYSRYDA